MKFLIYSPVEIFALGLSATVSKNFESSEVVCVLSHDELLLKSMNESYDIIIFDTVDYNKRFKKNIINLLNRNQKLSHLVLFNHYEFYLNLLPSEIKKMSAILRYDLSTSDFIYVIRYLLNEDIYIPKHLNLFSNKFLIPKGFEFSKVNALSDLELKVAIAFINSCSVKEISNELNLNPSNIRAVKNRIIKKLGLNDINDLKSKYAVNNLLSNNNY